MRTRFRISLAVAFSLLMVLTGQGMAMARGMPDPAGQIVLCTGHGPVMIYVDENGEPTGPPVLCPEAALSVIQIGSDAPPTDGFIRTAGRVQWLMLSASEKTRNSPSPVARGPPTVC